MKTILAMNLRLLLSLVLFPCFLFQSFNVFAQAGQNDVSFNIADNKYHFKTANTALLKQSDGKTLATNDWGNIMRLNTDGTLDETFLSGLGASGQINDAVMQPDGKIILVGDFILYNEQNQYSIIRLNSNGSVDNSFLGNFINIDYAYLYTIALQSDGKILVAGSFNTCGGVTKNGMVRLNSDGSLDNTFDVGTGVFGSSSIGNEDIYDIVIQPDGKILVVGGFTKFNDFDRKGIVRLNSDGSVDTSFNIGTGFSGYIGYFFARVYALTLQSDGKILVAGGYYGYNGTNRPCLVRLNTDGSIDNTFDIGTGFNNIVHSVVLQSDGKILVGGTFTTINGIAKRGLARLNTDGSIDNTFDVGTGITSGGYTFPYGIYNSIFEILLEPDGKILIGGNFGFYNGVGVSKVMRLNSDGSLDMAFERGTGFNGSVIAITKQPDGKILVGGFTSSFNQIQIGQVVRLHPDGNIDNSFQAPILEGDYGVFDIELQPDGKILVVGNLHDPFTNNNEFIIRLNSDGSVDNTFQIPGTGLTGTVTSCKYLPNGKILIGGVFNSYNGIPTGGGFIRLNNDGSLDMSFNGGGTGISLLGLGEVSEIVLQPNGKIIAGGIFSEYNGVAKNNLIRANENGSIDTTFKSSGCNDWVSGIVLQPNGKIIVGGAFTTCNGIPKNRIARLNADGSIDNTFDVGTGFKGGKYTAVLKMQLQDDGKVIVVGDFTSYNEIPIKNICRLNRDGSLDNTFQTGSSVDERIYTTIIDSNDKILIGGFFGKYQGSFRNGIARLQNCVGRISPKTLNPIVQGTFYTQTFTQTGISGNVTWQITSGNLPQGLSLNSSTGIISGIPAIPQTTLITLQVSNGICFSSEEFELNVSPCIVEILPDSLTVGTVGNSYSQTLTQIGLSGNITWQIVNGNLPQGLSLNTNTGEITGVPIISDSTEFEIAVLGGICLGKKKYQIKVLNTFNSCDITVYPNPTNQDLKIAFDNTYQGNYQIKLLDILGREIFISNLVVKQERELAVFNIYGLSKGVYILAIKGTSCEKLLKVVKVDN